MAPNLALSNLSTSFFDPWTPPPAPVSPPGGKDPYDVDGVAEPDVVPVSAETRGRWGFVAEEDEMAASTGADGGGRREGEGIARSDGPLTRSEGEEGCRRVDSARRRGGDGREGVGVPRWLGSPVWVSELCG